jgi:hypothetical protein
MQILKLATLFGLCCAAAANADTIAIDGGIAVRESGVATPVRGTSMQQVEGKFGAPTAKLAAVGAPPISRWEYPGFIVYFEYEHVVHTVVTSAAGAPAAAASTSASP